MKTRLFVALTFFGDDILSRKIQNFKKRYDPKFVTHSTFHMSLIAPFEINLANKKSLIEDLTDEIENYYYGHHGSPGLGFTGLDVHSARKHNILYLNPNYDDDLAHCMESVQQICMGYIPRDVAYRPNKKQFLPLGDFPDPIILEGVMKDASQEFALNSQLGISGISLFEKRMGVWLETAELISFTKREEDFLHSKEVAL
jgi:2'-5' RNA ligase